MVGNAPINMHCMSCLLCPVARSCPVLRPVLSCVLSYPPWLCYGPAVQFIQSIQSTRPKSRYTASDGQKPSPPNTRECGQPTEIQAPPPMHETPQKEGSHGRASTIARTPPSRGRPLALRNPCPHPSRWRRGAKRISHHHGWMELSASMEPGGSSGPTGPAQCLPVLTGPNPDRFVAPRRTRASERKFQAPPQSAPHTDRAGRRSPPYPSGAGSTGKSRHALFKRKHGG